MHEMTHDSTSNQTNITHSTSSIKKAIRVSSDKMHLVYRRPVGCRFDAPRPLIFSKISSTCSILTLNEFMLLNWRLVMTFSFLKYWLLLDFVFSIRNNALFLFLFIFQVRTLFVSGLPMDAKPRELYLLFRGFKVNYQLDWKILSHVNIYSVHVTPHWDLSSWLH